MIGPTVYNYTFRAYVPITSQKGFRQRCNHERLRLKWVEGKRVALEGHLDRVRQDMRDDVLLIIIFPTWIMLCMMLTPLISLGPPCTMISTPVTTGFALVVPSCNLQTLSTMWVSLIGSLLIWVSLIGSSLVSTCLLELLVSSWN